jgi:steroid delta-isomerase-like uncharacterized protein
VRSIVAIVFLTFMVNSAVVAGSTTAPNLPVSVPEQNKAVARRVFEEIFNQGKFQVADEIYAQDFVNHGLHRDFDLEEDQAAARWEKQTLPDLRMTVDLIMAEGDLVTVVWTLRGTNTRSIAGLPPTGVQIEERGITVWRIGDGKIREEWTSFDLFPIARQILSQLKWKLLGLLLAAMILVWVMIRFIRRLRAA